MVGVWGPGVVAVKGWWGLVEWGGSCARGVGGLGVVRGLEVVEA